jgi:hypothetical protein
MNIKTEDHDKAVIEALRRAARLFHADVVLILGTNPSPELILFSEDLDQGRKHMDLGQEDDDA